MRKVGTTLELEQEKKKNVMVIGGFLLFVLVIGTIGYGFVSGSDEESADVGDLEKGGIRDDNGRWVMKIGEETMNFANSPRDVENTSVNIHMSLSNYIEQPLYIVSENNGVASEIASSLGKYSSRIQKACYKECDEDLPEKTCADNLIVWNESISGEIYQTGNCIFINGGMKEVDAFLYKVLL